MANILAVVQGQVGDLITPSGVLMEVMKTEVLLASLPGLSPKLVVIGAASNPAIKNLLKKIVEVQIGSLEKEEERHVEKKKQPNLITTQYPLGVKFEIMCALTETNPDDPVNSLQVYHKIANLTKKLGIHKKIQH